MEKVMSSKYSKKKKLQCKMLRQVNSKKKINGKSYVK